MASGDLTATLIFTGAAENARGYLDAETLAAATDHILVLNLPGRNNQVSIIKVEREA
tara:strand:+ start:32 stop:202 length:171 start_codon:yes stop_codon:yes gene_type:complete